MALKITKSSLNEIRDNIRLPINIIKDKLIRDNDELFYKLEGQFNVIEESLRKICNDWEVWDE